MARITIVTDNEEMKKRIQKEADDLNKDVSVFTVANHISKKYGCVVSTVHASESTIISCFFPSICMKKSWSKKYSRAG